MMSRSFAAMVLAASTLLAACSSNPAPSGSEGTAASDAPSGAATSEATSDAASDAASDTASTASGDAIPLAKAEGKTTYPLTVESCGRTLTYKKAPEKVISVGFGTLPILIELGLADRITGLTQPVPKNTYPADIETALNDMPHLTAKRGASGHVQVSTETILASGADMTMGPNKDVDFQALAEANVQTYVQPGYCTNAKPPKAELNDIDEVVDTIAEIFDVPGRAEELKADLKQRVEKVTGDSTEKRGTAAIVFVTPGETQMYTYGTASMANVVMETVGLENVYADNDARVFELSQEDLLSRDPEHLIVVYLGDSKQDALDAFTNAGNMKDLKAVKDGKLMALPYSWIDPATPLVVDGIEEIGTWLSKL